MVFTVNHSLTGFLYGNQFFFTHSSNICISSGSSQFDHGEGFYIIRVEICFYPAHLKVFQGTCSLYTIVGVERNLLFTQKVLFSSELLGKHYTRSSKTKNE